MRHISEWQIHWGVCVSGSKRSRWQEVLVSLSSDSRVKREHRFFAAFCQNKLLLTCSVSSRADINQPPGKTVQKESGSISWALSFSRCLVFIVLEIAVYFLSDLLGLSMDFRACSLSTLGTSYLDLQFSQFKGVIFWFWYSILINSAWGYSCLVDLILCFFPFIFSEQRRRLV